jgi:hypothetical protein
MGLVQRLAGDLDGEPVGPFSITVRQQPEQAIEAPIGDRRHVVPGADDEAAVAAVAAGVTEVISPTSVTIPVNMLYLCPACQVSTTSPPTSRLETSGTGARNPSVSSPGRHRRAAVRPSNKPA